MKTADLDLGFEPMHTDDLTEPCGQRSVEAEHENRLALSSCQVEAAISKDHGLTRSRDAVDDAMTVPQRPCELLLLKIHDLDDIRSIPGRRAVDE